MKKAYTTKPPSQRNGILHKFVETTQAEHAGVLLDEIFIDSKPESEVYHIFENNDIINKMIEKGQFSKTLITIQKLSKHLINYHLKKILMLVDSRNQNILNNILYFGCRLAHADRRGQGLIETLFTNVFCLITDFTTYEELKAFIQMRTINEFNLLLSAIQYGNFGIYHSIIYFYDLNNVDDIRDFITPNKSGFNPLIQAIRGHNMEIIQDIIMRIRSHAMITADAIEDKKSPFDTLIFQKSAHNLNIFHQICNLTSTGQDKLTLVYNMIIDCSSSPFRTIDILRKERDTHNNIPHPNNTLPKNEQYKIHRQLNLFKYNSETSTVEFITADARLPMQKIL